MSMTIHILQIHTGILPHPKNCRPTTSNLMLMTLTSPFFKHSCEKLSSLEECGTFFMHCSNVEWMRAVLLILLPWKMTQSGLERQIWIFNKLRKGSKYSIFEKAIWAFILTFQSSKKVVIRNATSSLTNYAFLNRTQCNGSFNSHRSSIRTTNCLTLEQFCMLEHENYLNIW